MGDLRRQQPLATLVGHQHVVFVGRPINAGLLTSTARFGGLEALSADRSARLSQVWIRQARVRGTGRSD
jgi:hypothetical protein